MKTTTLISLMIFLMTLASLLLMSSCNGQYEKRRFNLTVRNGTGWSEATSSICCDSFAMSAPNKADIWCDGHKQHIESNNVICPSTTNQDPF